MLSRGGNGPQRISNCVTTSLPRPSRQARGREYPQMAAGDTVVPPHVTGAIRFHKLDREVDRVAK